MFSFSTYWLRCNGPAIPKQNRILFLPGTIAVQTVRDVLGRFLIAGSRDRFAGIGDDFRLFCMDRKIYGLERFLLGHCFNSRVGL